MRGAWVGAAALAFSLAALPGASHAQQLSPRDVQATQAALNNLINDCAQARERHQQLPPACVTPNPTSTLVPPKPAAPAPPPPTEAPQQQDAPEPTPTPCVRWLTDEQSGDPDNDYIVFVQLFYPDGSPALDADGNPQYGPVPIPCDATPTPTPEPTDAPTDMPPAPQRATPTRRPASPPAPPAPVRAVAPAAVATPRVVYVTVPADTPTPPLATDTPTLKPTATATATRTLVPAGIFFLNPSTGSYERLRSVPVRAAAVPRPGAVPTAQPANEPAAARVVTWTVLGGLLAGLAVLGGSLYAVFRWRQRRYRAELQAVLESEGS